MRRAFRWEARSFWGMVGAFSHPTPPAMRGRTGQIFPMVRCGSVSVEVANEHRSARTQSAGPPFRGLAAQHQGRMAVKKSVVSGFNPHLQLLDSPKTMRSGFH